MQDLRLLAETDSKLAAAYNMKLQDNRGSPENTGSDLRTVQ